MSSRGTATNRDATPPGTKGPAVLEIGNVSHSFGTPDGQTMEVLRDISFTVAEREFFTVVGPTGCGKTTLLNIAAGLAEPAGGSVRISRPGAPGQAAPGQAAPGQAGPAQSAPTIGYITQDSNLLPWCTVADNIMVGLEVRRVPKAERVSRAMDWAGRVGLAGFEKHYPRQLSGGMQKRCAIARTMVYDPDIVFMDEPFSALDAITRAVIQKAFLELCEATGKTVIFITHDLNEAIALSDRVAVMSGRPGRIKTIVDIPFARPRDVYHVTRMPGFEDLHEQLWACLDVDREP